MRLFLSLILLFLSAYAIESVADGTRPALDIAEFNKMYKELSQETQDAKCFDRKDFDACLSVWVSTKRENLAVGSLLYSITQQSQDRKQLEAFWNAGIPHYKFYLDTRNSLQAIYRRDAANIPNPDDYLKSFRLSPNQPDIEAFTKGTTSLDALQRTLSDKIVLESKWNGLYRDLAMARFIAADHPNGYYYAYLVGQNLEHLKKAIQATTRTQTDLAPEIYSRYLEKFVSGIESVADYATYVEKCIGCQRKKLYSYVAKVPRFAKSMALGDFFASPEYRYFFSKQDYSYTEQSDNRYYTISITSGNTTTRLYAEGQCHREGEYSTVEDIGYISRQANGGLESSTKAEIFWLRYQCALPQSAKNAVKRFTLESSAPTVQKVADLGWVANEEQRREYIWTASNHNSSCYSIRNEALRDYCEKGEVACSGFGLGRNREKYGIPAWVEDFCKSSSYMHIKDKDLELYYRNGAALQFKDGRIRDSAFKNNGDLNSRKRWVMYYANGILIGAH